MDIGLFAPLATPFATPAFVHAFGVAADERGFHSLWLGEHAVLFDEYRSRYPYCRRRQDPAPGEMGLLDPFGALTFLAGVTRRVRLGTGICLVPQRNPVYTAKEVADARRAVGRPRRLRRRHRLARARSSARSSVPFARRAARTRAYLEVMRRLWCDPVPEYQDEFYTLPACRHVPEAGAAAAPADPRRRRERRRARDASPTSARAGSASTSSPTPSPSGSPRLTALLAERGRARADVTISISPYMLPCDFDTVQRYRDAGVDQVILMPMAFDPDGLRAHSRSARRGDRRTSARVVKGLQRGDFRGDLVPPRMASGRSCTVALPGVPR